MVTSRAFALHGIDNVIKHAENVSHFGVPFVISINRFLGDSDEDLEKIRAECRDRGMKAFITDYREAGGEGGLEMAEAVAGLCETPSAFHPLYDLDRPIGEKLDTIARNIYGADGVVYTAEAEKQLQQIETLGYGGLPVCVAKTPASLSDDPKLTRKAPRISA